MVGFGGFDVQVIVSLRFGGFKGAGQDSNFGVFEASGTTSRVVQLNYLSKTLTKRSDPFGFSKLSFALPSLHGPALHYLAMHCFALLSSSLL